MTEAQAKSVVGVLTAAFPQQRLERTSVDVIARSIADLPYADAQTATQRLVRDCSRLPTVREIREATGAITKNHQRAFAETHGLPEPPRAAPPAEWRALGERLGVRPKA